MPTKFINRIFSLCFPFTLDWVLSSKTKWQRGKQQQPLLVPIVFHFPLSHSPFSFSLLPFSIVGQEQSPFSRPCSFPLTRNHPFYSLNYETKHKSLNKIIISATVDRGRARSSGETDKLHHPHGHADAGGWSKWVAMGFSGHT